MDGRCWTGNGAPKPHGIAEPTVSRPRGLEEFPEPVQERVEQGTLPPGTAYEIGKVHDPEIQQELAERVVSEGLNRTETMEAVRVAAKRTPSTLGKGRGAGRSRKVPTSRTMKAAGCKITVEHRKGVDDDLLATALREALDQIENRREQAA